MNMTDEQMRIAIAEVCGVHTKHCKGWTCDHEDYRQGRHGSWRHFNSEQEALDWNRIFPTEGFKTEVYTLASLLPDYLNDLNAMHEAEKHLQPNQSCTYWCRLMESGPKRTDGGAMFWGATHATARQRAIAFIKTLNLEPA
jgi:hypothetical protein